MAELFSDAQMAAFDAADAQRRRTIKAVFKALLAAFIGFCIGAATCALLGIHMDVTVTRS